MKILDDLVQIKFDKYEFRGLSLKTNLPWKDKKEMNDYYNNLLSDKNEENKIKYKNSVRETIVNTIHTYISWAFILKYVPIVLLLFAMLLFNFHIISIVLLLLVSPIPFLIKKYFINSCNKFYASIDFTSSLIDMMFELEKVESK
jgi:hypothetical protein